jgi:Arc/MetJ-type ribon-helix-helix transcriptional regulator
MIGLRITKKDSETIDQLIKNNQYKSVTQIARTALTEFLSKNQEVTPEALHA